MVQVGCLRKRWKCAGYEVRGGGAVLLAAVSLDTLASLASAETGAATTRLKLEVRPQIIFTVSGRAAHDVHEVFAGITLHMLTRL